MVTRHEFLAMLHDLMPEDYFYLEIGVHTGESLKLAKELAWGVDPDPATPYRPLRGNEHIFHAKSEDFFRTNTEIPYVDLAFIDGMHLWEYAYQDFRNLEQYCSGTSVIVFDDVLPYNQAIASRMQPPGGDWTGDVWKVIGVLEQREDLHGALVNTFPTGSLVVWGFTGEDHPWADLSQADWLAEDAEVPQWIINREGVYEAHEVIEQLKEYL